NIIKKCMLFQAKNVIRDRNLTGVQTCALPIYYYLIAIQITVVGTLMTGINFFFTIIRCKTSTMKFMDMPMFTVTAFITTLLIILAFPVLTVALALFTTDRIFDTAF